MAITEAQLPLGKSFNRLWSASFASNLTDGLLKTAAPLLATTLTKDPILISVMAVLTLLPWLLFAIPIGGLVDRVDRRMALATANAVRFLVAASLAVFVATDTISIPILYTLVFIFGAAEVAYDTTMQSMVPQVLERNQLERGNARLEITAVTIGEFVGAPISGLLFASAIVLPFMFGSLGLVVAFVMVILIPKQYRSDWQLAESSEPKEKTAFWADIRFGIAYLVGHKKLRNLVIFTTLIGMFFASTSSTMVLFVTEELGVTPALFGLVFSAPALGAIIGSVLAPKLSQHFGRSNVLALAMLLSSVLIFPLGLSPNVWFFIAFLTLNGVMLTHWNILLMSTYHEIIPNELFGRIHGTRRTLVWGLMPVGSLLGGVLATVDLRLPFFVAGVICTAIALVGLRFVRGLQPRNN